MSKVATPDEIMDFMLKPMEHYQRPREQNEIDLVEHVRESMIAAGLKDKVETAFDTSRFIVEARTRTAHAQQYLLNRYFTLQFMLVPQDTSTERYALIYEVSPDEWLKIYHGVILPAILNLDLPKVV
jgi:hypothetical protein